VGEVQHIVDDLLSCARSNVHIDLSSKPSPVTPAEEPVTLGT
jgi:hypothetical protein